MTKPTGNKRGRPSTLPPFNPTIPQIATKQFPDLIPYIESAMRNTELGNKKSATLAWLHAKRRFISFLKAEASLITYGRRQLTPAELGLLRWLHHNGKHDHRPIVNKIVSA